MKDIIEAGHTARVDPNQDQRAHDIRRYLATLTVAIQQCDINVQAGVIHTVLAANQKQLLPVVEAILQMAGLVDLALYPPFHADMAITLRSHALRIIENLQQQISNERGN